MASEDIGTIYKTQIPGYEDAADIQAALKLYHYGTTTAITQESEIIANSVVGHIKALDTRLDAVEATGIGSDYGSTKPSSPEDGFIWVDSASVAPAVTLTSTAIYQNSAPTTGLVDGLLWVDKNSSPLTMYVYDLATTTWKAIGA
jgi:hypothetical protein